MSLFQANVDHGHWSHSDSIHNDDCNDAQVDDDGDDNDDDDDDGDGDDDCNDMQVDEDRQTSVCNSSDPDSLVTSSSSFSTDKHLLTISRQTSKATTPLSSHSKKHINTIPLTFSEPTDKQTHE